MILWTLKMEKLITKGTKVNQKIINDLKKKISNLTVEENSLIGLIYRFRYY